MLGSIVFLTPYAGLVACALVLPLTALVLAGRRERRARLLLGLAAPPRRSRLPRVCALLAVPALLALAASEPALRSTTTARVRTDAQALYVLDTSRSMSASSGAGGRTRLARAKADAIAIRAALAEIPSGVATFTDRVLPDLFPDDDPAVFDDTVEHAVGIEQPPPAQDNVVATTLAALGALGTQNWFPRTASRRLVVLLTDGESRPFDLQQVARELATRPGIHLVMIHVWAPGELVYGRGQPEQGYREQATSGQTLVSLATATGGAVFGEGSLGAAIAKARSDLGSGPTQVHGASERTQSLAPYAALAALLPLLGLFGLGDAADAWRRVRVDERATGTASATETPSSAATSVERDADEERISTVAQRGGE